MYSRFIKARAAYTSAVSSEFTFKLEALCPATLEKRVPKMLSTILNLHSYMSKSMTIFISAIFLFCSCNNPESSKNNTEQKNIAYEEAEIGKLNDALKKYEEPSQIVKASANKPSVVTGRKGTKISINPDDLVTESGKPLGQTIEVELKELANQTQLLRTNAPTTSDGKLLVSGGAYFIDMTSNGEQLKLKEGKTLNVQFPKLSDKEMVLFYGQRNDFGQMNWQQSTETFKAIKQAATAKPAPDSRKSKRQSELEAIVDYIESDYNPTPEEKERELKAEKNAIIGQKVYDEIGIRKLGWINCDRFLEVENKTDLYAYFNPQDSIENANVYLIFKDINSVMQSYYYSDKSPKFENIPVGYKARLIAYTVKNEKVFAYSTELTITKEQKLTLNLKEINEKDFKKLMSN